MRKVKFTRRRVLPVLIVLLCLLVFSGLWYAGIIWPNTLFIGDYVVRGIDVSNHQKSIDWKRVARTGEYSFAFIKATEGSGYKDTYFQANWQGAKENGLLRGAYHFYIEYLPGIEQADHFINVVPKEAGTLPPVLDLEVDGKDRQVMLREIRVFLVRLEQHYGVKPIIYTDFARYDEFVKGNFEEYPLWLNSTLSPVQWSGFNNWTFWQFSSHGRVDGIPEFVDLNVFYGGREKLNAMQH